MEKKNAEVPKLSLITAIGILICFFLPWISVNCGAGLEVQHSGYDLSRTMPLLWGIPIIGVLILVLFALKSEHLKRASLILGLVSLGILMIEGNRFFSAGNDPLGLQRAVAESSSLRIGAGLTLVCTILLAFTGLPGTSQPIIERPSSEPDWKTTRSFLLLLGGGIALTWMIAQIIRWTTGQ